jgi:hypothetical protein
VDQQQTQVQQRPVVVKLLRLVIALPVVLVMAQVAVVMVLVAHLPKVVLLLNESHKRLVSLQVL